MNILFLEDQTFGSVADEAIAFQAGTVKPCTAIEAAPDDPNDVILTLPDIDVKLRANGRNIRVLTTKRQPDVAAEYHLVGHGYQVDYFVDGKLAGTECRDFSDSHKVPKLRRWLIEHLDKLLEEMRRSH